MRTFVITMLAVVIAATGMYSLVRADVFRQTCQTPISYRVGDIDEQFRVSSSSVQSLLSEAVRVWERNTERDLFTHGSSSADLVVNFTYDQRQKRTRKRSQIADDLSTLASSHAGLTESIDQKRQAYESARQTYERIRQQYEANLDAFNDRVERWNRADSVPSSARENLASERQRLNKTRNSLEQTQSRLDDLRVTINQLAERSNDLAQTYNQTADTFADRFGGGREFGQATYSNDTITVYQFNEASDLRLALAHELGHALGITHVNDPQAVMHDLMKEQSLSNLSLTGADQRALANVCGR